MSNAQTIVITVYGHDKSIDRIAVNLFDNSEVSLHESDARIYCTNTNSLDLKGNTWVYSKIVPEKTPYLLDTFLPLRFDSILKVSDRDIQKIMREIDSQQLAKALKGEDEAVQDKILKNMSKRAAEFLMEDMEYMGPIYKSEIMKAQEEILAVVRRLEEEGEIIMPNWGDELIP